MFTSTRFVARSRAPKSPDERAPRWRRPLVVRALRRPVVWWIGVALIATLTVSTLNRMASDAVDLADAWGPTQAVFVAADVIEVGDLIRDGTRRIDYPAAMIPANALTELGSHAVAVTRIHPGEVIVAPRVSGTGGDPAAAVTDLMLPANTGAVGLRRGDDWPQVEVGDRLNLLATFNPTADQAATTTLVAQGAVVVAIGERSVDVAVADHDIATTVHALSLASVTPVLVSAESVTAATSPQK